MWKLRYKESVKKDLKKISQDNQYIIKRTIEDKLQTEPLKYGLPLRRSLKGYMKLRIGDYRVIYSIEKQIVTVHIIKIGHRREVYK
ncbi:MAG: type II toxin-antitoxin system RelE/ParE family toxin [Bdellovibrionota bacterium]|nr:type II toxin-antitoxin system RelE/ParE family toxin [Bdellovibrionota bacterium]